MRLAWSLDQVRQLVDELFCLPEGRYGSYTRLPHGDTAVLDGMLFRFRLQGADESLVYELHIYGPIDEVSGLLWQNQARALMRLNALDHPSLPVLRDMAFDDEHKLAFSLTESLGEDLVLDDLLVRARHHPAEAARAYGLLIDAVVELHDLRLHHRNISPAALRVSELTDRGRGSDTGADSYRLTLNRFEMSSLLGDLLRGDTVEAQVGRDRVREMYKRGHGPHVSPARHLVYMPPERLQFLFSDELDAGRYEELTSDLYGLAVLGWELFVGSVEYELADQLAAVVSADDPAEALLDVNRAMRLRLRNDRTLPPTFIDLFDRALDPTPSARPSTFEFANEFNRDWDHLIGRWELQEIEQPYLVAYMPAEFSNTLYRYERWLQVDPADESGRDEIRSFFERELKRAWLVHWPTGAAGLVKHGKDLDRQTWVLVGENAVWFCSPLELGIANRPVDEALIIRAYKPIAEAQEVARARPWRRVPAIDCFAFQPFQSEDVRHRISGHPSWQRLMSSVKTGRSAFVKDHEFLQSIRFLLEYQQAQLDSRTYAYEEIESKGAGVHVLRTDRKRDLANLHRNPLLSAFSSDPQRRPPLGDLFEDLEGEEARALVARDAGGRPASGNSWVEGTVVRSLDDGTIEILARGRVSLPPTGWIRPWSDRGSGAALSRQQRVWPLLERNRSLVRSLREPWAFDLSLGRWAGSAGNLRGADRSAGPAPEGTVDATEAVPHMLGYEPLYALQGPPGSGKTTVAVQALEAYFARVPTARVLVSAQSNDALDNIGNKLIKELSDDVVIVRIVSDQREGDLQGATAGKVLHRLTDQTVTGAVAHATALRQQGDLPVHDQELLSRWQDVLASSRIELQRRLAASANIVLATCAMAGADETILDDRTRLYDWVLVEEAAKAWPTEVLIPLVQGAKWTLIGDHRQLGAHRANDVRRFLAELADHDDESLQLVADKSDSHLARLKLFASLFDQPEAPAARRGVRPVESLNTQFRMHPTIAEPVGRAFYSNDGLRDDDGLPTSWLVTDISAVAHHRVTWPEKLQGRPLVWLDTENVKDCRDQEAWSNPGEVDLVHRLVDALRAESPRNEIESIAVLTPYRAQIDLLQRLDATRGIAHTVHSFQGQEADAVLVSLVRDSERPGTTPEQRLLRSLGFVTEDEIVNVLLSRARKLLVIVGRYEHFRHSGAENWRVVCEVIEEKGIVLKAEEVFGGRPG